MAILNVYKPLGWTPLEVIRALRERNATHHDEVMTYAGRLDPMAEGTLILLTGEDRFQREQFLGLPKTYRAEFLLGYRSDSGDALGVVARGGAVTRLGIEHTVCDLRGVHTLPFPAFSSYRVKGKPLHWWAQQGRLHEIEVPKKRMEVYEVADLQVKSTPGGALRSEILERIALVNGDFRQQEITDQWKDLIQHKDMLTLVSCTLDVSSGTYIRALAGVLGSRLGCSALLFRLQRTRVGAYTSQDAMMIEKNSRTEPQNLIKYRYSRKALI